MVLAEEMAEFIMMLSVKMMKMYRGCRDCQSAERKDTLQNFHGID